MSRVAIALVLLLGAGVAAWAGEADAGKQAAEDPGVMYVQMCSACHGAMGRGDGPAASGLAVKPRDHTDAAYMNSLSDQQIFDIINRGGAAVGKFAAMPAWGQALTEQQIWSLVRYVRSLNGAAPGR